MMRLYPSVPHPFVLQPAARSKERIQSGEEITFGLVLIGRAIDLEPYFILAFSELGQMGLGRGRGKFDLSRVETRTPGGSTQIVYRHGDEQLADSGSPVHLPLFEENVSEYPAEIALTIETPMRVKFNDRLADTLPFHVLVRSLLRRVSALTYFHGEGPAELDYRDLIQKAENVKTLDSSLRWLDWERYSSRQDNRMKLGGLVGSIRYAGDLSPFWSLLRMGQSVHVGKGATFGLGRYHIEG